MSELSIFDRITLLDPPSLFRDWMNEPLPNWVERFTQLLEVLNHPKKTAHGLDIGCTRFFFNLPLMATHQPLHQFKNGFMTPNSKLEFFAGDGRELASASTSVHGLTIHPDMLAVAFSALVYELALREACKTKAVKA